MKQCVGELAGLTANSVSAEHRQRSDFLLALSLVRTSHGSPQETAADHHWSYDAGSHGKLVKRKALLLHFPPS